MTTTPTFWGNETIISNRTDDFQGQVVGLADNTFAIVWSDSLDIGGRHYNETGAAASGDFMAAVSDGIPQNIHSPRIVQQANGKVVVDFDFAFQSGDIDILRHAVNADFMPRSKVDGLEIEFGTDELLLDTTATASGGTASVFAYGDENHLAMRFYDEDGDKTTTSPIRIGEESDGIQRLGAVAGLSTGNVAIAYENFDPDTGIRTVNLAFVRPNGSVPATFVVGDTGNAARPDIARMKDLPLLPTDFVVVFQDVGKGIYFRRYNDFGVALDEQPQLIAGSANSISAKVTGLNDGGFIVAWINLSGMEGDGTIEQEIFLQRFDANGMAVGVRLEIDKPGDQILTSIATLDDGRVILTYQSETGDSTGEATLNYRIIDPRDDFLAGGNGDDNIVGREDGATLHGEEGNDRLTGRAADDTLIGGEGADVMRGGGGDDTYWVDNVGDVVTEFDGEGGDTVLTSVSYALAQTAAVEVFATTDARATTAIDLTGNQYAQTIQGNAGQNTIKGGGPGGQADELVGLSGNDRYIVYNAGDLIFETATEGTADRVLAGVSYKLGAGVHIEMLTTTSGSGTAAIDLTGNEMKQEIIGNAGNNILHDGGKGASDVMRGLSGNDTYRVFNSEDVIVETASQGTADRVIAAVDYRLGKGVHVEMLTTNGSTGTTAIDLSGNEIGQEITGNAGVNFIDGGGGKDTLRGGSGQDFFVFSTALGAGNVDTIVDYSTAADTIQLVDTVFAALPDGPLATAAFRANMTGLAADASDRIVYETDTGRLYYDPDGTGAAARIHFATLTGGLALTHADFHVVEAI
ncbi:calcium-binding protein [Mesorhizobium sp. LHD-90]|uniref:calcium-binding protein n=1 Tax=Mesorhizobium sp. LHD-90 TaxID=3071414 RepID=UPI0027E1E40A|nr:calcium-binding protein [Mesorhizobium sp. LHD-90]MDQ6433697.1 calcium-binding protein [Mesorhizobium sp. LHD-90]